MITTYDHRTMPSDRDRCRAPNGGDWRSVLVNLFRAVVVLAVVVLSSLVVINARSAAAQGAHSGGPRVDVNDFAQIHPADVYFVDDEAEFRNPDGETPDDAPLFNVAGVSLDRTWGEFSAADGRSLAIRRSTAGDTLLIVHLEGLVPDGVYSLFHTTFGPDSENPACPNVLRENPVRLIGGGTPRPDASSFTANSRGKAVVIGFVDNDLLAATQSSLQVIYHADGNTYHPLPNRGAFQTQGENCRSTYSVDAMRQLFILQEWIF